MHWNVCWKWVNKLHPCQRAENQWVNKLKLKVNFTHTHTHTQIFSSTVDLIYPKGKSRKLLLFTVAKTWKQPNRTLTDYWINKMCHVQWDSSALEEGILTLTAPGVNLHNSTLTERCYEKDKSRLIPLL